LSVPNCLVRRLKRGAYFSEPHFAVKRFFEVFVIDRSRKQNSNALFSEAVIIAISKRKSTTYFHLLDPVWRSVEAVSPSEDAHSTHLSAGVNRLL